MDFNFDFSYLKNGAPLVTLGSFGISFNKGAIDALGNPAYVMIGYDDQRHAIGVRAAEKEAEVPTYEFAGRIRNDWIRIGAKDFIKYLSRVTDIDCISKSKQFIATYDEASKTLIIMVDETHLK